MKIFIAHFTSLPSCYFEVPSHLAPTKNDVHLSIMQAHKISPHAYIIILICAAFLLLAILAVAFRVWARKLKGLPLSVNDYAIFAALVRNHY